MTIDSSQLLRHPQTIFSCEVYGRDHIERYRRRFIYHFQIWQFLLHNIVFLSKLHQSQCKSIYKSRKLDSSIHDELHRFDIVHFLLVGRRAHKLSRQRDMPATLPPPKRISSTLPQLVANTTPPQMVQRLSRLSMLFRIFDEGSASTLSDSRGFVAHKFRDITDIDKVAKLLPTSNDRNRESLQHIRNWKHGQESPWVSTNPLWIWAVMEGVRRVRRNCRGVMLAIIDISKLDVLDTPARKVFYGSELVNNRTAQDWANNPQEILVFGVIPCTAVISRIALSDIIPALPGFFSRSLIRPLRDHSDIIEWSSTRWSWFQEANASLLQTTLPLWCRKKSPEHHGLTACDLALALMRNTLESTKESIVGSAIEARETYDDEESFNCTMESLSHKLFTTYIHWNNREIDDLDLHEQYDEAIRVVEEIMSFVRKLAGKIASWGLDWAQDDLDGSKAWKEVQMTIALKVQEEEYKIMTLISAILDPDTFDGGRRLLFDE